MDASCVAAASSPRGSVDHWRAGSLSHADPFQGPARRHAKKINEKPPTHTQLTGHRQGHAGRSGLDRTTHQSPDTQRLRTVRTPRDTHDTRGTLTHTRHARDAQGLALGQGQAQAHTHTHTHEVVRNRNQAPRVRVHEFYSGEVPVFIYLFTRILLSPRARAAAPPFGHRRYHDAGWVAVGAKF